MSEGGGDGPRSGAEAVLAALRDEGVDILFLNPGTDSAPLQEAAVALADRGVAIPRIVASSFESVALAAAHGYWQVTRRPQAVFVHVDAGTQNLGAMVHNVLRDRAGVLVLAGRTPYGEDLSSPGGRSNPIHWPQDVPDQAGIVRSYAKWTGELIRAREAARTVGRALQVAGGGEPGLAYLTLSRDVLMDPVEPPPGLPAAEGAGGRPRPFARPMPPGLAPEALAQIADLLAGARDPLVLTSRLGRRPGAPAALAALADLLAVPVAGRPEAVNLAASHPLHVRDAAQAAGLLARADVVLVLETDVPWIPKNTRLAPGAVVIQVDPDPLRASMPMWTFPVDVAATADGVVALRQLVGALEDRRATRAAAWEDRRARLVPAIAAAAATTEAPAELTVESVLRTLNGFLEPTDIVVEEAVTNAGAVGRFVGRDLEGTMASAGGPGLGWALGASVGIKLAAPDRRVVTVVGDGSFMFGVPTAALCLAAETEAPFLTVVLDNDGYLASRQPVVELFPSGASVAAGRIVGTSFRRPPDFAAVSEACGAYGERVDDPAALGKALDRAFEALAAGQAAVVHVRLDPA